MDTPPAPGHPVCAPAPYRLPPLPLPELPVAAPRPRLAIFLAATAFALSLASFVVVSRAALTLTTLSSAHASWSRRPRVSLLDAAEDLARRHSLPLYIAPDVRGRARDLTATDCFDGPADQAVRALDAYAATRRLRLHVVDGVLRLETRATPESFACNDMLTRCAARLDAQGVAHLVVHGEEARYVRLYLRHTHDAVTELRAALTAAGFEVDVDGTTLHAYPVRAPLAQEPRSEDAVQRLDGNMYRVSRATLEDGLARGAAIAHIVPARRGGRVVGVRLVALAEDSVPAWLGLRAGDVLLRVNGIELSSSDLCLAAYANARDARFITLELLRGGRPLRLRYVIT